MKPVSRLCMKFICLLILLPGSVYSETKNTENIFNTQDGKIKIEAISWELKIEKAMSIFSGEVKIEGFKVDGDDLIMSCQKLELYFKNTGEDTPIKSGAIEKIIATESIEIKCSDGSYATAEKAEYVIDSGKIILTGNPYFTYSKGIEGRAPVRLVYDLKEKSFTADGTKEDKATLSRTGKDER
jgi:lipopolysaccharide export system protein LptA